MWIDDNEMDSSRGTNAFPNVGGKSADSMALLREAMGDQMTWAKGYRYVPGLRQDDPGDLVLMYFDKPTRWTWHSPIPPTIFKKKAWIFVPVDFTQDRPFAATGEFSERVPLDEFRSRLRRTLDFVRTNERPNWQPVVAEHTAFLNSIEKFR